MLHSWSYYPATLSCSLCLRLKKNKYTFGFVGVFHQQGPCTWSLPFLYEQVHFEQKMEDLQLPNSTKWRAWIYEHKHTRDTSYSGNHCHEVLEDINYINNKNNYYYNRPQQNQGWNQQRPNYSERRSRTPRHPDLHLHGGLPRSTLRLCLQRQHYAQACRSDTKFPKGNIEEPLHPSWYLVRPNAAKISLYIKGRKEKFSFKNKTTQILEQSWHEPRKRTNRRNRNKQLWTESAKMVTAVQEGQDRRLMSPFLTKEDDPAPDGRSDIPKGWRLSTWEKSSIIHPSSSRDRSSAPLKQSSTWNRRSPQALPLWEGMPLFYWP